jgi:hypothetical protein
MYKMKIALLAVATVATYLITSGLQALTNASRKLSTATEDKFYQTRDEHVLSWVNR